MEKQIRSVILIVLDSVGIGQMPDAAEYGDEGSNTLGNTAKAVGGLFLPHMERLGVGHLTPIQGVRPISAQGFYGKMMEQSPGKDSTTGHWEIAGLVVEQPFDYFPDGFPEHVIRLFEERTGRKTLGNFPASGTEIIKDLGEMHIQTGGLIVYTSADSVFQIAAHESVVEINELYRYCEIARTLLDECGFKIARVIARPFEGIPGAFVRTPRRHDFSLPPDGPMLLDHLVEGGVDVVGVGKIYDLYAGVSVPHHVGTTDNMDGVNRTLEMMDRFDSPALIFTNLVDFDMKYGHRNDYVQYAKALEAFDRRLPELFAKMKEDDLLILTADHGCDPTTVSTDHSREMVPVLGWGKRIRSNIDIGTRSSFADLGQTVADLFSVKPVSFGLSFKDLIL